MKAEPEAEAGGKEEEAAEETYERDATELLGAFKDAKEETDAEAKSTAELMQDFLADMRAVDRDNEVCRILWAFKLNPFEKMNLRFDSTESEVRKQYRCAAHARSLACAHMRRPTCAGLACEPYASHHNVMAQLPATVTV